MASAQRSGLRFFAGAEGCFATGFPTLAVDMRAEERSDRRANNQYGDKPRIALAAPEGERQERPEDRGGDRPQDRHHGG
jgi:hypothetical protein